MTIRHHPSAATLGAYVSGALDAGRRLVVASHLERCPHCRRLTSDLEEVGGALLETVAPATMGPDALENVLARLDLTGAERPIPPDIRGEGTLPAAVRHYPLGRWRRVSRGIEMRPILLPKPHPVRVFLLRGQPGTTLLQHSHRGEEFTTVLTGAYAHTGGTFGPGDFEEADETVEHRPVVTEDGACICLVALEGLRFGGLIGTLLNPVLG